MIEHFLLYDERDGYWRCRSGYCSFSVHEEDLERLGYTSNPELVQFVVVDEEDFESRMGDEDVPA